MECDGVDVDPGAGVAGGQRELVPTGQYIHKLENPIHYGPDPDPTV